MSAAGSPARPSRARRLHRAVSPPPHRAGVARARGRHPHPRERLPARRGGAAPGSSSSRWRAASAGAGTPSWGATPSPPWWAAAGRSPRRARSSCPPRCRRAPARGSSPPSTPCSAPTVHRRWPTCPRCTAGSSATWATTWCARSSTSPTCPATTRAPRRRPARHRPAVRLRPLAPARGARRQRGGGRRPGARPRPPRPTTRPGTRLDELAADLSRPLGGRPARGAASRRAVARGARHHVLGVVPGRRAQRQGAHPGRRHLPGRAVAALRPRSRRRSVRPSTACCGW